MGEGPDSVRRVAPAPSRDLAPFGIAALAMFGPWGPHRLRAAAPDSVRRVAPAPSRDLAPFGIAALAMFGPWGLTGFGQLRRTPSVESPLPLVAI
ncbi:hypothetical protein SVIO_068790 [Streptomyces violaceusniger]|uniref:Uncharacterized protein n=1 Tax=Streptomyces violaceusniger TaxID=68280 RepID=A0A4D4LAM6_STRVO|nr:hypothetical protein SVIO_068790 [Streptomyces violaceusniger]